MRRSKTNATLESATQVTTIQPHRADWKNAAEYPVLGATPQELAWEFLRRNQEYANHVAQLSALAEGEFMGGVKKKSLSKLDGIYCWPAAAPNETAQDYFSRTTNKKKNLVGRIDTPYNSFINRWGLANLVDPCAKYDPSIVKFSEKFSFIRRKQTKELTIKSLKLFLYPNEIAIRFRADFAIPAQIEKAAALLKTAQKDYQKLLRSNNRKATDFVDLSIARVGSDDHPDTSYWLRTYDARRTPITASNGRIPKNARCTTWGEIHTKFHSERSDIDIGRERGWLASAKAYIEGKKFMLLLNPSATTKKKNSNLD